MKLKELFGDIDIYLFDQLLKDRYNTCKKIIDVGCGNGRNLVYFLQNDFEVFAIDSDPTAIEEVKKLSQRLSPQNSLENFRDALAEDIPFENEAFDLVISSAVLHFAKDKDHFDAMLQCMWQVLKPGGFFFARLASTIGIENRVIHLGKGRYLLPDGSERFLVDEKLLINYTKELNGELYEYIKTTNVQNLRCMTTWCLKKNA